MGRLVAFIAVFAVIGIPIVAFLWETLNHILALQTSPRELAMGAGALVIFLVLLAVLAKQVRRLAPSSRE